MTHSKRFRRGVTLAAVALVLSGMLTTGILAAPPTATVVGTTRLDIRSCPRPSCAVVTTAPSGGRMLMTGEVSEHEGTDRPETGSFVPVEYGGKDGYAQDLFLTTDAGHVPYLLRGSEGCNRVALIFNVGVGEEAATSVLDTLKAKGVPATMFVMGWWADERPAILQRMVDEGYPIGSHGYDSVDLPVRSDDEVVDDVRRATAAIEQAIGRPIDRYFTPYASAIDERVRAIVAGQGYLPVAWEVYTGDFSAEATAESVYDRVMDDVHDGAIVELHLDAPASAESTGRALPRLIDELRAQGYQFVTIPEMTTPCLDAGGSTHAEAED